MGRRDPGRRYRYPQQTFDRVLVAIGRKPVSGDIGLENTKVELGDRGVVVVDDRQRTTDERIFAVGDVVGGMILATEMGALAQGMALRLHPRPTLSETEGEAAEIFLGSATHILSKSSTS